MNLQQFTTVGLKLVDRYMQRLQDALATGAITTTVVDPVFSFPQSGVVTALPSHFALELVGGRKRHRPLKAHKRSLEDADLFVGQFPYRGTPIAMVDASGAKHSGLAHLALVTPGATAELARRFPGTSELFLTQLHLVGEAPVLPVRISAETNFFTFSDVLLVNAFESMVRIRHIRFAILVRRDTSFADYEAYLESTFRASDGAQLVGVQVLERGSAEVALRAAQFANVFLMDKLHETTLGSFLDEHRDILLAALGGDDLLSEVEIEWQVPSPDPNEHAVRPDLFVSRRDGYWDVWDLKLPLLGRRDITTGKRSRRRFVHPVEDGIAQLAHYREFLTVPENQQQLLEKYGVRLREPTYGLIVGSYENVDSAKVTEARRRLAKFEMIDYDTVLQLYVAQATDDWVTRLDQRVPGS